MTYSSAVFESSEQSLADAQRNKYRRMAELAGLERGQHVLEIGTGWGGFALYAAGELGCRVTSLTISQAQHELASARIAAAGLSDQVDIQLRDYRDVQGTYDAIVSIEMLEAVGAEYYRDFFSACGKALKTGGSMSVQVITFPHDAYEAQLRGANWIQRYIFPGGVLPSLAAIEASLEGTQLLVTGRAGHPRQLRAHPADVADELLRTPRRGARHGLRRPLHPHVGLLPVHQRGGLPHRHDPGPPDLLPEAPRPGVSRRSRP